MTTDEKMRKLEEILDHEEGSINENDLLDNIEEYDSLAKLSIMVMFEDEFDIRLKSEDFLSFTTVSDILNRML